MHEGEGTCIELVGSFTKILTAEGKREDQSLGQDEEKIRREVYSYRLFPDLISKVPEPLTERPKHRRLHQ